MNTSVKILIAAAILLAPTASFARGGMHGGNAGGMDHSMSTHWQGDVSSNTSSKTTKTWTTDHNKHEVIVQKNSRPSSQARGVAGRPADFTGVEWHGQYAPGQDPAQGDRASCA